MSNKWSQTRINLSRPKICEPPPPPPPPEPTAIVAIQPNPDNVDEGSDFNLQAKAFDDSLDPMTLVELSIVSGGNFAWNATTIFNVDAFEDVTLENNEVPGTYNVVTRFSWEGAGNVDHPHVLVVEGMM